MTPSTTPRLPELAPPESVEPMTGFEFAKYCWVAVIVVLGGSVGLMTLEFYMTAYIGRIE